MTRDQQKRLNALCGDLSAQIRLSPTGHYVNKAQCPEGIALHKDDWRHMFCGSYLGWRSVPALEGFGFIMLGRSSLLLDIDAASEVMTMIEAFGADREVQWTDPEWESQEAA